MPLKPSGPPLHPSRPTVQKTEGVEFTWAETSGIEKESAELLKKKALQRKWEELEKMEQEMGYDMEKLLARADDLSHRRTEHLLVKVKGSLLAKVREELLGEMTKRGQFTQLALTEPEILIRLGRCM